GATTFVVAATPMASQPMNKPGAAPGCGVMARTPPQPAGIATLDQLAPPSPLVRTLEPSVMNSLCGSTGELATNMAAHGAAGIARGLQVVPRVGLCSSSAPP